MWHTRYLGFMYLALEQGLYTQKVVDGVKNDKAKVKEANDDGKTTTARDEASLHVPSLLISLATALSTLLFN